MKNTTYEKKRCRNDNKNNTYFSAIVLLVLASFATSVTASGYSRPCGDVDPVDLCSWDVTLPLGSPDNFGCSLQYNTYWTPADDGDPASLYTVTCNYDGTTFVDHTLWVSIDNDIVYCTLNGNTVSGTTEYTTSGCADADPRDGHDFTLDVARGQNTLICQVRDNPYPNGMNHFDACIVGDGDCVTETCDGIDNDCDGDTDEEDADGCTIYYEDVDRDGYGDPALSKCLCAPEGDYDTQDDTDCEDGNANIYPGKEEECNDIDDDCDIDVDEDFTDEDCEYVCEHNGYVWTSNGDPLD